MKKLELVTRRGKNHLVVRDLPDLEEAKRLWREGLNAQQIVELHRKRKKKEDEDS